MVKTAVNVLRLIPAVFEMWRSGISMHDITQELDWYAALERAIKRTGREDLRQRTDPCVATCVTCCAIERAQVRHYIGAEDPPAPGSSWSVFTNRADVEAEFAAFEGMVVTTCDDCRRVWSVNPCGCSGGACSLRLD
jgi:hypothetical protein